MGQFMGDSMGDFHTFDLSLDTSLEHASTCLAIHMERPPSNAHGPPAFPSLPQHAHSGRTYPYQLQLYTQYNDAPLNRQRPRNRLMRSAHFRAKREPLNSREL